MADAPAPRRLRTNTYVNMRDLYRLKMNVYIEMQKQYNIVHDQYEEAKLNLQDYRRVAADNHPEALDLDRETERLLKELAKCKEEQFQILDQLEATEDEMGLLYGSKGVLEMLNYALESRPTAVTMSAEEVEKIEAEGKNVDDLIAIQAEETARAQEDIIERITARCHVMQEQCEQEELMLQYMADEEKANMNQDREGKFKSQYAESTAEQSHSYVKDNDTQRDLESLKNPKSYAEREDAKRDDPGIQR